MRPKNLLRPIAMWIVVLVVIELGFSVASPLLFGHLADRYLARVFAENPPGAPSVITEYGLRDDGLKVGDGGRLCAKISKAHPCTGYFFTYIYVGGNPLCGYWKQIRAGTIDRAVNDGGPFMQWWRVMPPETICFWQRKKWIARPPLCL